MFKYRVSDQVASPYWLMREKTIDRKGSSQIIIECIGSCQDKEDLGLLCEALNNNNKSISKLNINHVIHNKKERTKKDGPVMDIPIKESEYWEVNCVFKYQSLSSSFALFEKTEVDFLQNEKL